MKNRIASIVCASSCLCAPYAVAASGDVTFTFAPPPVTEQLTVGQRTSRLNLTYLSVDIPNSPLTGVGAEYVGKTRGGGTALAISFRGMSLSSTNLSGYNIGTGLTLEGYLSDSTIVFGGFGYDMMQLSANSFDATTGTLGLQLGIQQYIPLGDSLKLVPYAMTSKNKSSTSTSIDTICFAGSFTYSCTQFSDTTSSYNSTTFGFDFLIKDLSLGFLATSGGSSDVTMLHLGFKW